MDRSLKAPPWSAPPLSALWPASGGLAPLSRPKLNLSRIDDSNEEKLRQVARGPKRRRGGALQGVVSHAGVAQKVGEAK